MTATGNLRSKPRRLSQTYLVFPEWYIVYATDDLAKICHKSCASDFPYFHSIAQFWYAYFKVSWLTRKLPFNFKYHMMLIIIGISFSIEMLIKGFYEKTIGRMTWIMAGHRQVPEDKFLADMTTEYGKFMHTVPWYKFNFTAWNKNFNSTPNWDTIRSYERRLVIKTDLWIKTLYARLIGSGVQALDEVTLEAIWQYPSGLKILKHLPRYQNFDNAVKKMRNDVSFIEIAGNKVICLSILVPKNTELPNYAKRLYSLDSLTDQAFERVIIELGVERLLEFCDFLRHRSEIQLEKIYDY